MCTLTGSVSCKVNFLGCDMDLGTTYLSRVMLHHMFNPLNTQSLYMKNVIAKNTVYNCCYGQAIWQEPNKE